MVPSISMGSWNPICSQRFLTGHLGIVGAFDQPSTFCEIQGYQRLDSSMHLYTYKQVLFYRFHSLCWICDVQYILAIVCFSSLYENCTTTVLQAV